MFWNSKKSTAAVIQTEAIKPKTATWHIPGGKYSNLAQVALDSPHTLIAGTTGCGKTTFLRSVLQALLVKNSPKEAKLILIDPKMIELNDLANIPHTMRYTDTASGAAAALSEAIAIMEDRYKKMHETGVKSWDGCKVYVIIDELADLMLSEYANDIKKRLQRLLQLGRSAKIVIIAGTQCPNRKVIPAELVCNFPCRFGLRCLSQIESRQIVGFKGCELLPEHGEAIMVNGCNADRYALPFVTENELAPLLSYWRSPAAVTYGY